jgi:hypothetical protein
MCVRCAVPLPLAGQLSRALPLPHPPGAHLLHPVAHFHAAIRAGASPEKRYMGVPCLVTEDAFVLCGTHGMSSLT